MEPGTRIEFNPFTGEGTVYTSTGMEYPSDVSSYTNGRFDIRAGNLIDTQHTFDDGTVGGYSYGFIGKQGPASFATLEGGRVMLSEQTILTDVNSPKLLGEQRMIRGTQNILLPDGTRQTLQFSDTPINRLGRQTVAVTNVDGGINLMQFAKQYGSTNELRADIANSASGADPSLYRLATPEETLRDAIAGGLLYADKSATGLIAKQLRDEKGGGSIETDDITSYLEQEVDMSGLILTSSRIFDAW